MQTFWYLLVNTPWWVHLIFCYLLFVGINALESRVIPLVRLVLIPIVFFGMSVEILVANFSLSFTYISTWFMTILLGVFLGWAQVYNLPIEFDRRNSLVRLPGTWVILCIILVVFFSRYFFNVFLILDPKLKSNVLFVLTMLTVSGIITGFFIGRLWCCLHRFKTEKNTTLVNLSKRED
jgi:hypothetical protein